MFTGVNIADQQEFTNAPEFSGALNVEYRLRSATVASELPDLPQHQSEERRPLSDQGSGDRGGGQSDSPGRDTACSVPRHLGRPCAPGPSSLQGSNLADKKFLTTGYVIPSLGVGPVRRQSTPVQPVGALIEF